MAEIGYSTISALTVAVVMTAMQSGYPGPVLIDFSSQDCLHSFRIINDGVMGGVSTSRLGAIAGAMVFEGELSLENEGGFASFRGPVQFPPEVRRLLFTVRGDGQRYKLILKPDDSPGTGLYQASFVAPRAWRTLCFETSDFTPSFRGRPIAAPPLCFPDMHYFGLLIADKQAGAFRIEVKSLAAGQGFRS